MLAPGRHGAAHGKVREIQTSRRRALAAGDRLTLLQAQVGNRGLASALAQREHALGRGPSALAQQEHALGRGSLLRQAAPEPAAEDEPSFIPAIQAVWDANKARSSKGQREALVLLNSVQAGVWKNLAWPDVAKSAADRVYHPEHIDQNVLGLCGPAAALEADAEANAGDYAIQVWTVFEEGLAGGAKVSQKLLDGKPPGGMDPCDWMMLSAMQDEVNLFGYTGAGQESDASHFTGAGARSGQEADILERFDGCVKTTEYSCAWWGVADETTKAGDLIDKHGNDVTVVMGVDSTTLQDEDKRGSNDHWARLLKLRDYNEVSVKFDVFTWGTNKSMEMKTKNFEHMVDSYIVGARKQEIEI